MCRVEWPVTLAILCELRAEIKSGRFFRISCLYCLWAECGEIVALTGHRLRGGVSEQRLARDVERALGVQNARRFSSRACRGDQLQA